MTKEVLPFYIPTEEDIEKALNLHKREASFTKLKIYLDAMANTHGCKYVDWHKMKEVVENMFKEGKLERVKEPGGYYRYGLPYMFE